MGTNMSGRIYSLSSVEDDLFDAIAICIVI